MNGVFVTGTDTNAGKTYVSCALARRATALGHRVLAFKPIETGCEHAPAGLLGADQELLAAAAGGWQTGTLRGVFRFPLPAAPLVAAEAAGSTIDLDLIERTFRQGVSLSTWSLVEGAGGWRVPITATADMSTLAQRLRLPVVVVARAGLGTINHSLLSLEAIERDGLRVAGLVLSQRESDDPAMTLSNRAQIQRRWSGPVFILSLDPSVLDPLVQTPR